MTFIRNHGKTGEESGGIEIRSDDFRRVNTITENVQIVSNSKDDGVTAAEAYVLGIYGPLSVYHPDQVYVGGARLKGVFPSRLLKEPAASQDGDPAKKEWYWTARLEWTSDIPESPLYPTTPADVSWSWEKKELPVYQDRSDPPKPIVNTVGDPFDPALTVEFPIPIKTMVVNLEDGTFTSSMMNDYFMAISDDVYEGWAAGCAKVDDFSATVRYWVNNLGENVKYWVVTIKVAFNAFGWQPNILNQGFRYLQEFPGPVTLALPILGPDGQPVQTAVPLDEDSQPLFGEDVTPDNVHFIKFVVYNEISFDDIAY